MRQHRKAWRSVLIATVTTAALLVTPLTASLASDPLLAPNRIDLSKTELDVAPGSLTTITATLTYNTGDARYPNSCDKRVDVTAQGITASVWDIQYSSIEKVTITILASSTTGSTTFQVTSLGTDNDAFPYAAWAQVIVNVKAPTTPTQPPATPSGPVAVSVYENINFGGGAGDLPSGKYNKVSQTVFIVIPYNTCVKNAISDDNFPNDWMSSLKIQPGYRVILCEDDGYRGKYITFNNSTTTVMAISNLCDYGFNDKTSSMLVEKISYDPSTPVVHGDCGYLGNIQVLSAGEYRKSDLMSLMGVGNDTISSIQVPPYYVVYLYEDDNFGGAVKIMQATGFGSFVNLGDFNDKTSSIRVVYNQPVTGVALNKSAATLGTGVTDTLTATVSPSNAANKTVTWQSNNPSVAAVDSAGKVTTIAPGTATITVTTQNIGYGSYAASCVYTVFQSVKSVTLNKTSSTLGVGCSETLTATLAPSDAKYQTKYWVSNNTAVVTVDANGIVTAVGVGTTQVVSVVVQADGSGAIATLCAYTVTP